ncbi:transporter [Bordetella bronchiseptica]|uniref:SphA family protein n=1 Tax=Bordetella bronchiseptica TaxID=518 RepID=UPI00045B2656|nr:transporter [Bordetella bronchiseptica]KCV63037.1 putative MetA-pathway of phenol degradation [Bordetella bronchiseptica 99-R-0433]
MRSRFSWRLCSVGLALALTVLSGAARATEGALGRLVTGTTVQPNAGVVSPQPITVLSLGQLYLDGRIGGGREVPVAGKTSLGLDAEMALTLATLMKTWDTGPGRWNFASSLTIPYLWLKTTATLAGERGRTAQKSDIASNLFDLNFTPLIAGYHFSETQHLALSLSIWAPTGKYDPDALANPSLNNWTFIPQAAYTGMFPEHGLQLDAVANVQFYTRNTATDYRNAPILGLELMGRKLFGNGVGAGLIVGTQQQLGSDKGPTADRLNGFKGRDWALGPILTYDRKLADQRSLSFSLRWTPTISSTRRLDSDSTVLGTVALIF